MHMHVCMHYSEPCYSYTAPYTVTIYGIPLKYVHILHDECINYYKIWAYGKALPALHGDLHPKHKVLMSHNSHACMQGVSTNETHLVLLCIYMYAQYIGLKW